MILHGYLRVPKVLLHIPRQPSIMQANQSLKFGLLYAGLLFFLEPFFLRGGSHEGISRSRQREIPQASQKNQMYPKLTSKNQTPSKEEISFVLENIHPGVIETSRSEGRVELVAGEDKKHLDQ